MTKRISTFTITAGLLAFVFVISGPVFAHDGEDHSGDVMAQQTGEEDSPKPSAEELKARLEQRKASLKLRLSNTEKTRIQSRCKNSQGNLRSVEGRIKGIETSRTQVYGNLVDRLKELSTKLQTKDIDTTKLDEQIKSLEDQIATFQTKLTEYKQAVADLGAMDCGSDPEAFKAALEQARTLRKTLHESGKSIKKYVIETIKPTLAAIRAELAAKETSGANSEGTN